MPHQANSLHQYLLMRYGNEMPVMVKQLSKSKISKARLINRQTFLRICRDENITPKGLNVKVHPQLSKDPHVEKQRQQLESTIVKRELQKVRRQLSQTIVEIRAMDRAISTKLLAADYVKVTRVTESSRENEFLRVRERQIQKIKKYRFEQREKRREERN